MTESPLSKLEELSRKREIVKNKLNRVRNFVEGFTEDDDVSELEPRMARLNVLESEFDRIQEEIELFHTDGTDNDERDAFESRCYSTRGAIDKILKTRKAESEATASGPTRSTTASLNVKLPELKLPHFDGRYVEWFSFADCFKSLVHENPKLNNCERFHYLKSQLKGDALRPIESLAVSGENYLTAWEILRNRFENKRLIVHEHVNKVLNSRQVQNSSSFELRCLIDGVKAHVEALKVLAIPIESWDAILVPIVSSKFDMETKRAWQAKLGTDVPTFDKLLEFAVKQCQTLEAIESEKPRSTKQIRDRNFPKASASHVVTRGKLRCTKCEGTHYLSQCPDFLDLSAKERGEFAKASNLCYNCLSPGHAANRCNSSTCRKCNWRHHTLLHFAELRKATPVSSITPKPEANAAADHQRLSASNHATSCQAQVLLSTAVVLVRDVQGKFKPCRALLDVGSQANFVRKALADKLKLKTTPVQHSICGVSQNVKSVKETVKLTIKSRVSEYRDSINCFVLDEITRELPVVSFAKSDVRVPRGIKLADEAFHESSSVDMLIGAALFWDLLLNDRIRLSESEPIFIATKLGWIAGGTIDVTDLPNKSLTNVATREYRDLEARVGKFLQLEECSAQVGENWSPEQQACEEHFAKTHSRAADGRFVVSLPPKNDVILGESLKAAKRRFLNLERKFERCPELRNDYVAFMHEYEKLGHMTVMNDAEFAELSEYNFLPHHPVFKPSSTTTKLRVVFDASAKTTNGLSLNDNLMCGPTVQDDLFAILIRFRCYKYVVGADIAKMYRQIWVDDADKRWQLILWRTCPSEPIKTYKLNTITYGTKPASFLATRCLKELAQLHQAELPKACKSIQRHTYMDDILTGTDDIASAIELRDELTELLARGGFELSKWVSNDCEILPRLEDGARLVVNFDKNFDTKALGLCWNCKDDLLKFDISCIQDESGLSRLTKRTILSTLASIFDPLGLAGPVVTRGKIILRELWSIKLSWDEAVPTEILVAWCQFLDELSELTTLKIDRPLVAQPGPPVEIHGFADASMKAYGAVVYVRSKNADETYTVRLLCSKSRVAPQRVVSLPRLELCAAHLLARLMNKVASFLEMEVAKKCYWTDSSIVLAWLAVSASNWQTFVANRVAEIHNLSATQDWRHVDSANNPADLISRGTNLTEGSLRDMWLRGPEFLTINEVEWPRSKINANFNDAPEARKITLNCSVHEELISIERFSKLYKLQRTVAYMFRFINNCRGRSKRDGQLTVAELRRANTYLVQRVQATSFAPEIEALTRGKNLANTSKLLTLSPFLDDHNVLLVGGRIKNARVSLEMKHPILLPRDHKFTELLIQAEHERQLHAGPLATLAAIRQRFWVLSGRSAVKRVIRRCMKCFRAAPLSVNQKMGDLPSDRLTPSRPFAVSGVDYAGPFLIKEGGRGRSKRLTKVYIALFVCFTSKAVHLELVSDLTSESFLNALRRMIARRGHVAKIYSDNATNFVGAKRELSEIAEFLRSSRFKDVVSELTNLAIEWHFIPPRSPHMGGLWEVNVKSVKTHLKRVTSSAELKFEEMQTLLCRIEACLNSRPISPLSSQPDDLSFLTPGHFLIGAPLTSLVEPDLSDIKVNRLSRWQLVERLRQQFWRRWTREYLAQLQTRSKWVHPRDDLRVGELVLIVDDNNPPLYWKMGRVVELHPGRDGLVRVVTLRVSNGLVKRAVSKLCVLPIKDNEVASD